MVAGGGLTQPQGVIAASSCTAAPSTSAPPVAVGHLQTTVHHPGMQWWPPAGAIAAATAGVMTPQHSDVQFPGTYYPGTEVLGPRTPYTPYTGVAVPGAQSAAAPQYPGTQQSTGVGYTQPQLPSFRPMWAGQGQVTLCCRLMAERERERETLPISSQQG